LVAPGVHLDEGEPPAAPGLTVADDLRAQYGAELGERLDEVVAGGVERDVPDVQLLTHGHSSLGPSARQTETGCAVTRAGNRNGRAAPGPVVRVRTIRHGGSSSATIPA